MLPSMWFMSIIAILVVDVRTGALQQKEPVLHRCYHCAANATAACLATAECPADRPLCATTAVAPNYLSSLQCAPASTSPCTLTRTSASSAILTLVCVCAGDLCNFVFSKELQSHLLEFSKTNITNNNATDYTETFFKFYSFANVTEDRLYKTITVELTKPTELPLRNVSHPVTTSVHTSTTMRHPVEALPHAEAFKHEPTALSEDDEDASEGSGSYEETRSQRQPASAPAAPSSYLPAHGNKAPPLAATFLITTPILMCIIV